MHTVTAALYVAGDDSGGGVPAARPPTADEAPNSAAALTGTARCGLPERRPVSAGDTVRLLRAMRRAVSVAAALLLWSGVRCPTGAMPYGAPPAEQVPAGRTAPLPPHRADRARLTQMPQHSTPGHSNGRQDLLWNGIWETEGGSGFGETRDRSHTSDDLNPDEELQVGPDAPNKTRLASERRENSAMEGVSIEKG